MTKTILVGAASALILVFLAVAVSYRTNQPDVEAVAPPEPVSR